MARLDKTIQNYQEQLKVKGIQDVPEFVQSILDADITKGKYSRFLLDCFLNDKFREEDLQGGLESTIGEAISLFHKYKGRLSEEMRSVYQYDSPGSLWNAVKQFDGELSGKELKKDEKEKIYGETKSVYEDENTGFKIVSPLTEESAKWWGKGTRWCTAAEKNNAFWRYAKDAPLLIFLMPGGEKLQLWKTRDSVHFMDEADNKISLEYIEKNWDVLKPVCLWLKKLQYLPEEYKDYDTCLEGVKHDGYALKFVPQKLADYNLCLEAVKQDGEALLYVPEQLGDYNLCLEAVKQNGWSLRFIPEELRDYDLYSEAVKKYGGIFEFVPKELMDYNLCIKAVEQNGLNLEFVPKELIDYNLCIKAVEQNGLNLEFVPEKLIDYNLCLKSVKQDGDGIKYVPNKQRDYDLCLEAVKQNGYALKFISKKYKDYNLCMHAVKINGYALKYVPDTFWKRYRDYNLCLEAVKQNGNALKYVPEKLLDYNLCLQAVKSDGSVLEYVPEEIIDYNLCLEAVKNDGNVLEYVPEEYADKFIDYINEDVNKIPEDIYQQKFSEIRSLFPEKTLSFMI